MKTFSAEELKQVLDSHIKWLHVDPEGIRANLSGAYLGRANLIGANLSEADLSGANLSGAYLGRANLSRAYLSEANLSGANLSGANLGRANLSEANLSRAYLSEADLSGANLGEANLSRADLSGASLSRATLPRISIVPDTGAFIGWKKLANQSIAKLQIPAKAGRVNSTGRKCRAEYVKVLEIRDKNGDKVKVGQSVHNPYCVYKVGQIVHPDKFDPDFRLECTSGIHFFITRKEAEEY